MRDYKITSGQDPNNKVRVGSTYTGGSSVTFSIGRKCSEDVANWFNHKVPNSRTTFNHSAGELNFALFGELQIEFGHITTYNKKTFAFYEIMLAQGHAGASNNWWFGGNYCSGSGSNAVKCTGYNVANAREEYSFRFERGGNQVNLVELHLADNFTWS